MRPKQISCLTAETASRLLREVANGQVEKRFVPATLRAVARWIEADRKSQAAMHAGVARLLMDAAQRVGEAQEI